MSTTEEIRRPIVEQLAEYERFMVRNMRSDSEYVGGILDYIISGGGKGFRPMTVLLCASLHAPSGRGVDADANSGAGSGVRRTVGARTYLAAMLVEMMHTASLVHDDVIDESDTRRGRPSMRAMAGSRAAVIAGDMILAKSIVCGLDSAQYDIVDYVVRAMSELCEGELIQSEQSRKLEMTREIYLDIIGKKTAVLFGVSAGVGALSVGAPRGAVAEMREFGELIGRAFQIKDDILDYDVSGDTGKPACNDLRERKITLPLLAVLERSSPERRAELLARLAAVADDPENIAYLHDTVVAEGGIEEAERVMRSYVDRAVVILAPYPSSPCKTSLEMLAAYAAERKK
ncbi:MAG: polyprenyl synthetase family protein [Alistipes sp.]|jgi:octaprenyl-diphosphate synthase|nr:polyprenyl synthetase family protein [Alistipes sp.]